jgi:Integrase core domain
VLLADTAAKQHITSGQLTIHADRGSPMTAKPVAFLLAELGVTKSHSRPHVSNDNPYSESQFRTMKYRPTFPDRFGSYQDAHAFCGRFFGWYNHEHRHSGIGLHTPADVHYGRAELVQAVEPTCSPPPTTSIPSASSASLPPRRRCRARSGSTSRRRPPRRRSDSRGNLPQKG